MISHKILCFFMVLCLVHQSKATSDREREFLFNFYPSKRLTLPINAQQQSKQVKEKMDCVSECTEETWCHSINLKITSLSNGLFECQLLSSYRTASGVNMTDDVNYNHYSIKNPCDNSPCGIGGECKLLYNRKDYRCDCKAAFQGEHCKICTNPVALGMQSKAIPDSKITASSIYSSYYPPHHGRLNLTPHKGAWAPNGNNVGEWIQVDLADVTMLAAVATQGRSDAGEWVTSYSLQHSSDGVNFQDYEQGKVLPGNGDQNTVVKNDLTPTMTGRFIRLLPKTSNGDMTLRMELYGCK